MAQQLTWPPIRCPNRAVGGVLVWWATLWLSVAAASTPSAHHWRQLPPLPNPDGVAGAFAGVSGGALLVAGGANFPDRKPWDGGRKVWHDQVWALDNPGGKWQEVGRLPRPLGYGVSVTTDQGVACLGGSDAKGHYAEAFVLSWADRRFAIKPLPPLPIPLANAAGARVGHTIWLCGGAERPGEQAALSRLFSLDLAGVPLRWQELPACPGQPRILPMAAAAGGAFYVAGGIALIATNGQVARHYLCDGWRFDPDQGWQRLADLPRPWAAGPSPAPVIGRQFWLVGGDDGSRVGFQPVDQHPGFKRTVLAYDCQRGSWQEVDEAAVARATVPCVRWRDGFVIPSGEVRPGVRSPEVWCFTPGEVRTAD